MAKPRLARDASGAPMLVMMDDVSVAPGKISTTITTANVALPAGAEVVRLACTQNCYYKWGSSAGVTAANTDRLLPAGTELKVVPLGMTHIAAIRDTADGVLTVDAQA